MLKITEQFVEKLSERQAALEEAKRKLKEHFVGLDTQIDRIIESIRVWHCMPEILTRPVIVNLWGMTGTGKTDLVRKLAKHLGLSSKILEVQMDTPLECGWKTATTLQEALLYSDIEEGEKSIVLLDEFQRFRTLNKDGSDRESKRYSDTWMLLSDGVFNVGASKAQSNYNYALMEEEEFHKDYQESKNDPEIDEDDLKKLERDMARPLGRYQGAYIKKILRSKCSLQELVRLPRRNLLELLQKFNGDQDLYQGTNFNKSLIFVCGNIDEAYSMASAVADADQDADILHKYSLKINIVTMKKALGRLFKPEQIARLGNNHVIYPCLSKSNYRKIVKHCLDEFINSSQKITGIKILYEPSIIGLLYKNFVYPAQGVRPVFSGVNNFLSQIIPPAFLESIVNNDGSDIKLCCRDGEVKILFVGTEKEQDVNYSFDLDFIKKNIPYDKRVMFSVHEAGHALIYAVLFGYAPKLINTELTSFDGAYVIPNEFSHTKKSLLDIIRVYLGGTIAEEIVFSEESRSSGCEADIRTATECASELVRDCGLDKFNAYMSTDPQSSAYIIETDETNKRMLSILDECAEDARRILNARRKLLKKIADHLIEVRSMRGEEFCKFLADELPGLKYIDPLDLDADDEIIEQYGEKYDRFRIDVDGKKNSKKT